LRAEARPNFCSVEALGLLSPEAIPTCAAIRLFGFRVLGFGSSPLKQTAAVVIFSPRRSSLPFFRLSLAQRFTVCCFRWSVLNLETAGRSFHRVSVSPPANVLSESLFRSRRATVGLGSRSTVRPRLSLSAPRALLDFASHGARREDLSHRLGKLIRAPGFRRPPEARRRCFLFAFELKSFSIQSFSPTDLRATGHRHATRTLACLGQHAGDVTALRRVNLGSPGELCHRFGFARG
jgi:hypothetical protein